MKSYLTESSGYSGKGSGCICAAFARGNLGKAIHLASSEEFKELSPESHDTIVKNVKDPWILPVLLDCIREIKEDEL